MNPSIDDRVLALAGLLQALTQVRRIAETGQTDNRQVETALASVFRIDAASTEAVYGSPGSLNSGLQLLRDYLANGNKDEALGRLVLAVLQVERRFIRNAAMAEQVQSTLQRIRASGDASGGSAADTTTAIAQLYAETISTLRPKVMVQGNPHYLGQAGVVAEIRALLLAGLRSAVLWRQLGGSLWDFLLQRRAMAAAIDAKLG